MSLELALLWPPYLQIISMRVPGRRRRRRRDNTRTVQCFTYWSPSLSLSVLYSQCPRGFCVDLASISRRVGQEAARVLDIEGGGEVFCLS